VSGERAKVTTLPVANGVTQRLHRP